MKFILLFSILNLLIPQKTVNNHFNYSWAVFLNEIGEKQAAKKVLEKSEAKNIFYYIKLGEFEEDNFDKTIEYFKKAESIDENNKTVLKNLGRVYFFRFVQEHEGDDLNKAKNYLHKYLELEPDDFLANYLYGETQRFSGNIKEAIKYFLKSYSLNPGAVRIVKQVLLLKISENDFDWILKNYKKYKLDRFLSEKIGNDILSNLENKDKKFLLAHKKFLYSFLSDIVSLNKRKLTKKAVIIYFKCDDYRKVISIYKRNFVDNGNPVLNKLYIFSLFSLEENITLVRELKRGLKEDKSNNFINYIFSRYYYRYGYKKLPYCYLKKVEGGIAFINKTFLEKYRLNIKLSYYLVEGNKKKLEANLNLIKESEIKELHKNTKIKILRAAIFLKRKNLIKRLVNNSYEFKAIYLANNGKLEDIIKFIEEHPEVVVTFLSELSYLKDTTKLLPVITLSKKNNIGKELYYFYYGRYYELSGYNKKALKYFKKACFNSKNLFLTNYYLYFAALNDFKIKNLDEAVEALLKENSPFYYDTIGYVLMKEKKYNKAEEYLLKAYRLCPEDIEIKFHLAEFYFEIENYRKALYFYNNSLKGEKISDDLKIEELKTKIRERINFLREFVYEVEEFYGLYSVKLRTENRNSSFRMKILFDKGETILKLYHFPMSKFSEIYKSNSDFILINFKTNKYFKGKFDHILQSILGVKIDEGDILDVLGIKNEEVFVEYEVIKTLSYEKGIPSEILITGQDVLLKLNLLKYEVNKDRDINKTRTDKYKREYLISKVFDEED